MIVGNAVPTDVLGYAGKLLIVSVSAVILSSNASAADLRLRIRSTVGVPATTPPHKTRKQLFEEFLELKRQQFR
jgi:hypothetical protein